MQAAVKIKIRSVDDILAHSEGIRSDLESYLAHLAGEGDQTNSNARRIQAERLALDSYEAQMQAMRWKVRFLSSLDLRLIPCVRFTTEQDLKVHFAFFEPETLSLLELTALSLRMDAPSPEDLQDCIDLSHLHRSGCLLNGRGEVYSVEYDDLVEWLCFL